MTVADLHKILNMVWSIDTAYEGDKKKWTEDKKSTGQCTVTAMIVQDYFGGKIKRGYSEKYNLFHYWNEINGEKIDLTYDQFSDKTDIEFIKVITKTKNDLMKIRSVRKRYILLKNRVEEYINNI